MSTKLILTCLVTLLTLFSCGSSQVEPAEVENSTAFVLRVYPGGAINSGLDQISVGELLDTLEQEQIGVDDLIELQLAQGCTYEDIVAVIDTLINAGFENVRMNDTRELKPPPTENSF